MGDDPTNLLSSVFVKLGRNNPHSANTPANKLYTLLKTHPVIGDAHDPVELRNAFHNTIGSLSSSALTPSEAETLVSCIITCGSITGHIAALHSAKVLWKPSVQSYLETFLSAIVSNLRPSFALASSSVLVDLKEKTPKSSGGKGQKNKRGVVRKEQTAKAASSDALVDVDFDAILSRDRALQLFSLSCAREFLQYADESWIESNQSSEVLDSLLQACLNWMEVERDRIEELAGRYPVFSILQSFQLLSVCVNRLSVFVAKRFSVSRSVVSLL
jgi:hypothetical protein